LPAGSLEITDAAMRLVISEYTREAGVRNLERQLGTIARKVAARIATRGTDPEQAGIERTVIDREYVDDYLGPARFKKEVAFRTSRAGVATGVAWTETGGDVLFIEATLGISPDFLAKHDLHVHVPAGAIPKDGPSAGVTMATAMLSAARNQAVRQDVAMTGEITLSGRVLPVGGIKEKVLAAKRLGIREIILPRQNEKNVNEDLTDELRKDLTIHLVNTIDEVLLLALLPVPRPGQNPRKPARRQQHAHVQ
jgi:ATP-dependent Lon protease